ncbi:hypothetical protein VTL71DRAFT_4140 [Oculimacula yallundae]|uniref:Uncharacterized protein n=1 Tax=Oculimacula yallundae TaxID=86028 RepID=A0ABR4C510_9HELO
MRLSTISLSILASLIRVAIAQDDDIPSIIIIPIIPTVIPQPVEENPVSTTLVIDPPTATSAPFIDPIPDPLHTSEPIEPEVSSAIPEITISPTPPEPVTTSEKEDVKTITSTTGAASTPESTKTIYSTAVITEKTTSQPETSKASSASTAAPSASNVPFTGGASSLIFSVGIYPNSDNPVEEANDASL